MPDPAGIHLLLHEFHDVLRRFLEGYMEEKRRATQSRTFEDSRAANVLSYLLQALSEDTGLKGGEDRGWRSLARTSLGAGVSRRSLYGDGHFKGRVLAELRRQGVIEERIETGSRGRGGEALKIRILQP